MPLPSRRTVLAGAASAYASIALVRAPARAAQFEYKYGNPVPIGHPLNNRATEMWEAVKRESGGRLVVAMFPNNQLGGDTATLTQLRSGAVQFLSFTGGILGSVVPVAGIESVGFAFKTQQDALRTMNGPLGDYVKAAIEAKGIHPLYLWANGYRQITSSTKPIRNADDLAGFKIRTPAAAIWLDLFRTLGASPTPMNFSEVYTSLQTHVIDGQENPFGLIESARLFEVQKYLSVTNHMWSGYWLIANGDAWTALPPDIQKIVSRNAKKYGDLQNTDVALYNASLADKLARRGMILNYADTATFRAKLGPFYAKERDVFGPTAWGLLEASVGKLS